jgi:hypothetical protein
MTKKDLINIMDFEFIGNYSTEKMNKVATAVLKFCKNYETDDTTVDVRYAIDGCLQFYNLENDLFNYLQKNKQLFLVKL